VEDMGLPETFLTTFAATALNLAVSKTVSIGKLKRISLISAEDLHAVELSVEETGVGKVCLQLNARPPRVVENLHVPPQGLLNV